MFSLSTSIAIRFPRCWRNVPLLPTSLSSETLCSLICHFVWQDSPVSTRCLRRSLSVLDLSLRKLPTAGGHPRSTEMSSLASLISTRSRETTIGYSAFWAHKTMSVQLWLSLQLKTLRMDASSLAMPSIYTSSSRSWIAWEKPASINLTSINLNVFNQWLRWKLREKARCLRRTRLSMSQNIIATHLACSSESYLTRSRTFLWRSNAQLAAPPCTSRLHIRALNLTSISWMVSVKDLL